MTGSDMGGLFIGFAKYICIFFGVIIGVGALFTSGWLFLLLAAIALLLLGLAWKFHVDIRRSEEAFYASRRQSEASMRQNNPAYDALRKLSEEMHRQGLRNFTTGQRDGNAPHGSGSRSQYLLVRAEVSKLDGNGKPITMKDGTPAALWQSKVPTTIGDFPVRVEFVK
jgi:hypothetical protein